MLQPSAGATSETWNTTFAEFEVGPCGDGVLCLGNPFYRLPVVASMLDGLVTYELDLSMPPVAGAKISGGETWKFSFWYRQVGTAGFNFSDALAITFCD